MKKNKTKKFRKRIGITIIVLLLVWWFSNFTLTVNEVTIRNSKIKNEITIVQLSDLHGSSFGKNNSSLIKKVEQQNPDLVVVTGDMFTHSDPEKGGERAVALMKALAEKYTVYFVNGEHDNSDNYFEKLRSAGVNVLNYKDEIVMVKDTPIHLYGISNVYFSSSFDLKNAFEQDNDNFSVLLAHIPNFEKYADFGIDLSICGDTHGNIFRLPFIGAIYGENGFLPERLGERTKGLYTKNNSKMFISSGLGNYPAPLRFCNRPEIAVIKLMPEN